MGQPNITHRFVDDIPDEIEPFVLYVSVEHATAIHLCACGCGHEVVTPLSPTDWELIYNGESVSLNPSIGNWSFPCRSHYWIKRDRVMWAPDWSKEEVRAGRLNDAARKKVYYEETKLEPHEKERTTWQVFVDWLRNTLRIRN